MSVKYGFEDMGSYDVLFGWDAREPADINRLWCDLEEKNPTWVTSSPPCTKLSIIQNCTHFIDDEICELICARFKSRTAS